MRDAVCGSESLKSLLLAVKLFSIEGVVDALVAIKFPSLRVVSLHISILFYFMISREYFDCILEPQFNGR